MNPAVSSTMFKLAALFNWGIALGLFLVPGPFLGLLGVTPPPEQSLWVQQFAALVLMFGIGYWQAAGDLARMASMIRLAVWAKWGVVLVGLLNVLTGDVSWQFMIPASVDGIFAVLFTLALRSAPGGAK